MIRQDGVCNIKNTSYIYEQNDSIFFFDNELNSFQLLYNFSASKNDSWDNLILNNDSSVDTFRNYIDSVYTVNINSIDLRAYDVTYIFNLNDSEYKFSPTVIEKFGDIHYMFNLPMDSDIICDDNDSGGLSCYEDPEFGFYSTGIAESCDYVYVWTGINKMEFSTQIELFPNSVQDFVEIKIAGFFNYSIELTDLNGKLLKSGKTTDSNFKLDLSQIDQGTYVILVKHNDQIIGFNKLIKE